MKNIVIALSLLSLSGCAMPPSQSSVDRLAMQARARDTMPTCNASAQCQNKWDAAQVWVSKNAGYKIRTATTALIETYEAVGGSTDFYMRVTKEPLGDGKYQMNLALRCDNFISCRAEPYQLIMDFNNYINSVN